LLRDIQFPDYLFDTTINSSPFEEKEPVIRFKDEETALERYKIHMRLLKAWKDMDDKEDQIKKFTESGIGQENLKVKLIIIACFHSFLIRRLCCFCHCCPSIHN
jgi:hypothetical protein